MGTPWTSSWTTFPQPSREQAVRALEMAKEAMESYAYETAVLTSQSHGRFPALSWLGTRHVPTQVQWDGTARATANSWRLARDEYDVLITVDQSIPYQQNITERDVAVVVLEAGTNDIEDLRPLVPELLNRIPHLKRGEVVRIEAG